MTRIIVSRFIADAIVADGGGLLVMGDVPKVCAVTRAAEPDILCGHTHPLDEWVEAAQSCECGDLRGSVTIYNAGTPEAWVHEQECPDCLDSKRIVTVQVECDKPALWDGVTWCNECDGTGLVTVCQVTVTWGPLPIMDSRQIVEHGQAEALPPAYVQVTAEGQVALHEALNPGYRSTIITFPPDVDPVSLPGQWVVLVEVV